MERGRLVWKRVRSTRTIYDESSPEYLFALRAQAGEGPALPAFGLTISTSFWAKPALADD